MINKLLKNNRTNTIIYAIVGLVLCIFVYNTILSPFFKKWSKQASTIKQKKQVYKNYKKLLKNEDALTVEFETLSRKIQAKLPVEREESQFLSEIGRVAQENSIHISTMNPRAFKDIGTYKELSVDIEMEANLGNLVRFLYYMRKSSVVLVAKHLKLEPKSERSALLKGNLVISTIFLKDK